ncbi:MAG: hypothetical protein Q9187_006791, partial [Circinaria calcarea]
MAHDESDECFTPTPKPTQAKRVKPIVPAIPRALERRPKKDYVKSSPTLDVSTQQVEQGPVEPQANPSGKAPVPDGKSDYRGFSFLAEDRGLDLDLGALKIEDDEST